MVVGLAGYSAWQSYLLELVVKICRFWIGLPRSLAC